MDLDVRRKQLSEDGFGPWESSLHGKFWLGLLQVTRADNLKSKFIQNSANSKIYKLNLILVYPSVIFIMPNTF